MIHNLKCLIIGIFLTFTLNANANILTIPETGETFSMLGMGMLGIGLVKGYKMIKMRKNKR